MVFVACGLSYKTAPLTVRETVALSGSAQQELLQDLMTFVDEAMMISTCNRKEVYCYAPDPSSLQMWFERIHRLSPGFLSPHLYLLEGPDALRHLFRVAAGLDSMMIGEPQILGQLKQAYQQACEAGTIKAHLRTVFEYTFSAAKRIRHQSGISANPISIAYMAVQLINSLFTEKQHLKVLLIGSGETAALVAKYLQKQGVNDFFVASRTLENAEALANTLNGQALTIDEISQCLSAVDVVISASACPFPFIHKNLVKQALIQRNHAKMFFLDLAVPRDIEPTVGELEEITLYNIDDLQTLIAKGMHERQSAALLAEEMISAELENFIAWHRSLNAKTILCNYRHQMDKLAEKELKRAQLKLSGSTYQETVLQEFCARLVNKLTHYPTVGLKQMAYEGREELLDLTEYLFNL